MSGLNEGEIDSRLQYMMDNVSRWLQFAEAKNGIALTASGGLLFAILGTIYSKNVMQFHAAFTVLAIGLFLTVVWSLVSLMAKTTIALSHPTDLSVTEATSLSLIFFGEVRMLAQADYVVRLEKQLGQMTEWQKQLADQIWQNSRIAYAKYWFFNGSLFVMGFTGLVALVAYVIHH